MFQRFQLKMSPYIVFSVKDIVKEIPSFDKKALVYWQKKGYINKIRNKYYCFTNTAQDEFFLFLIANKIYHPSYISFESALAYYNVIPEGVYTITSASTLKTTLFSSSEGMFSYRKLKSSLFFGYQLIKYQNQHIKIAGLEKTVLDYIYLNTKNSTVNDFIMLRWNKEVLRNLNFKMLAEYQQLFQSKALNKRMDQFLKYLNA